MPHVPSHFLAQRVSLSLRWCLEALLVSFSFFVGGGGKGSRWLIKSYPFPHPYSNNLRCITNTNQVEEKKYFLLPIMLIGECAF